MHRVLYFVSSPATDAVATTGAALESVARSVSPATARSVQVQYETSVPRLLAKLRSHSASGLIIDARGDLRSVEECAALNLLRALFDDDEIGGPIGREQTWVVVSPDERGDRKSTRLNSSHRPLSRMPSSA